MKYVFTVFLLIAATNAFAYDARDCAEATDNLRSASKIAADAADNMRQPPTARELDAVKAKFSNLDNRLNKAKSDCGISTSVSLGSSTTLRLDAPTPR